MVTGEWWLDEGLFLRTTAKITVGTLLADNTLAGPCWVWTAWTDHRGYGRIRVGVRKLMAHRVVWSLTHRRDLEPGEELDHLCRNRPCVNPAHMEVVDHAENCRRSTAAEVNRARNLARTHCKHGHAYSDETVRLDSAGRRRCLPCRDDRKRAAA